MWVTKMMQVKTKFKGDCGCTLCMHTYSDSLLHIKQTCLGTLSRKQTSVALALGKLCIGVLKLRYIQLMI